jgi:hypothetical protein
VGKFLPPFEARANSGTNCSSLTGAVTKLSRKKPPRRPDNRNKTQTARSLFFRCCYRLRKHADRIQARAVRRCGELLKQFNGRGVNQYTKDDDAAVITQKQAADDAGLSERQRVTAVRVANVPEPDFDAGISR